MSINNVGPYVDLGKVTVTKWGEKNADGERLDCYWNIAKNELGEDATAEEINAEMLKIMELNASKKASGEYDPMLHTNDELLMPIKSAIEDTKEAYEEVTEALNTAYDKVNEAGIQLAAGQRALTQLKETATKENDNSEAIAKVEAKLVELQANYDAAVQEAQEAAEQAEELQAAVEALQGEYEAKIGAEDEELVEYKDMTAGLDEEIAASQKKIEDAKAQVEKEIKAQQEARDKIPPLDTAEEGDKVDGEDENVDPEDKVDGEDENVDNEDKVNGDDENVEGEGEVDGEDEEVDPEDKVDNGNEDGEEEGAEEFKANITISSDQAAMYAEKMFKSMDGWGTDEASFNEVFNNANLTDDDWVEIINTYNTKYGDKKSFIQAVDGDFSGNDLDIYMEQISQKLVRSAQNGNEAALELIAKEIYNGTAGMTGTADQFVRGIMKNCDKETLANLMDTYTDVTGSELYKDIESDFSGQTEKDYLETLGNAYKEVRGAEYTGWDDGKLSVDQTASAVGKGVVNKLPEVATVAAVGVGAPIAVSAVGTALAGTAIGAACAAAAPVVAVVGIVAAIGFGIFKIVQGVNEVAGGADQASNAKTDAEAQQGVTTATEGVIDIGEGVFSVYEGGKAAKGMYDAARTADEAVKSGQLALESGDEAAEAASQAAGATDDTAKGASQAAGATDDAAKGASQAAGATDDAAKGASQAAGATDDAAKGAAGATDDAAKGASQAAENADEVSEAAAQTAKTADEAAKGATQAGESLDDLKAAAQQAEEAYQQADAAYQEANKLGGDAAKEARLARNEADAARKAANLKVRVAEAENTINEANGLIEQFRQNPTDKSLYRRLQKMVHPDNAQGMPAEIQKQFEELIKTVNGIYAG